MVLIAALCYALDWDEVKRALMRAQHGLLAAAIIPLAMAIPLAALRWLYCARASGIELPLPFYIRATYSGLFAGQFLPAGVGVDAVRLAYFMHGRARLAHALQSLVLDRLVGVVAMVFVMGAGLPAIWGRLPLALKGFGIFLVIATVLGLAGIWAIIKIPLLIRYEGVGRRRKLIDLILAVRGSMLSSNTAKAFIASVVIYCMSILGVYWIAASLSITVGYGELLAVVSMAMFLALLPVSLNGWGVREGAMVVGFAALAVPRESALIVSILFGFGTALATLPGAFIWYTKRHRAASA